jgi:hypothetical protein
VSTNSNFSGFTDNGASSSCDSTCSTWTQTSTSGSFTAGQPGTQYYWKVRASHPQAAYASDWTSAWTFTAASISSPAPTPGNSSTTFSTGAYGDNENRSQTLSIPGASSLTVTVNGQTEGGYDFVSIFDANGTQVRQLSGEINTSFTVSGASIRVQFTSDGSVRASGATVTIASGGATPDSNTDTPTPTPEGSSTTFSTGAYGNNENRSQTLSIPGASSLTVTVNGQTEGGYDFVSIFDANGTQVRQLSGEINTSFTVSGASIRVQFTSDDSVRASGATVTIASQ